jgi:phosphate transport system substrate-binding protein
MTIRTVLISVGMMFLSSSLIAGSRQQHSVNEGSTLAGTITSVGSDTMKPLLGNWSDLFRQLHPGVEFSIEARGSGTAAAALAEGRSQIAPMSRPMEATEVAAFGARYGYAPTGIRVALDAVALYVHPDNPVQGLTLEQLDGIFSAGQRCGGKRIVRWNELVKNWRNDQISIVGRDKLSGTHDFFRSLALCKGDFSNNYEAMSDSSHVVWKVAQTPNSIGFAGIGYLTQNTKLVPLAKYAGEPYTPIIEESSQASEMASEQKRFANVISGKYPLSRFLFIYVNKPPNKRVPPLIEEFLKFVLSKDGRDAVAKSGFVPLGEDQAIEQQTRLKPNYLRPWWGQD